jgi:hypothetical protein
MKRSILCILLSIASIGSISAKSLDAATVSATQRCSKERQVREMISRYGETFTEACLPYFSNTGLRSLTWTELPRPTQFCESKMQNYKFLDLTCTKHTSALGDVSWYWIAGVPNFKSVKASANHLAKILSRAGGRCNWDIVEGLGMQLRRFLQHGVTVKRLNKRFPNCTYYKVAFKKKILFVYEGGECVPRETLRGCSNPHITSDTPPVSVPS